MDFKTRKLRKEPRKPKQKISVKHTRPSHNDTFKKPKKNSYKLQLATLGGGILVILVLIFGIYQVIRSMDFSSIVFSFGKTLQTDETGKTNIMLVGTGGAYHDGGNLTDTIIVASIDYQNNIVPMLSIPRDFYIISKELVNQRINSIYYNASIQYGEKEGIYVLREIVSDITGLPIQYYVKVDFDGFVDIVDSLGGIDILVEESIYDPYYPKGETIYFETFKIDAGLQHIDGETALKYARSRKTTSDFDRAKRQQQLLYAIKDTALSLNILADAGKIKSLYSSVGDSIETNLSLAEIIEMAKISRDFDKEDVFPMVINDDPSSCAGWVYTPAREYFDGAAVLLPAGNGYEHLNSFVDFVFNNIKVISYQDEIQVLNGTKTPGLAGLTMNMLLRNCLNVMYYGNASDRSLDESTIYYKPGPEGEEPKILASITELIPVKTQAGIPPGYLESERRQNSTIVIELGSDYIQMREPDPFSTLKYLVAPYSAEDDEEKDETTEEEPAETTESTDPNPTET